MNRQTNVPDGHQRIQFDFAGLTALAAGKVPAAPVADAFMSDAEEQAFAIQAQGAGCLEAVAPG